ANETKITKDAVYNILMNNDIIQRRTEFAWEGQTVSEALRTWKKYYEKDTMNYQELTDHESPTPAEIQNAEYHFNTSRTVVHALEELAKIAPYEKLEDVMHPHALKRRIENATREAINADHIFNAAVLELQSNTEKIKDMEDKLRNVDLSELEKANEKAATEIPVTEKAIKNANNRISDYGQKILDVQSEIETLTPEVSNSEKIEKTKLIDLESAKERLSKAEMKYQSTDATVKLLWNRIAYASHTMSRKNETYQDSIKCTEGAKINADKELNKAMEEEQKADEILEEKEMEKIDAERLIEERKEMVEN
ncbi:hypothetical protein PFISCL1PPCAC_25479, partial [Pristionchus fissidentatus]